MAPTSPSRCSSWRTAATSRSRPGLYTLWYQVPGLDSSKNIDLIAIYLTGAATVLLLLVPFLPGLRDIPRWVPIHRLVWRDWNRLGAGEGLSAAEPMATGGRPSG